jgi:ribosome-binding protein aMBF1 (putative translation factor)
MSQATPITEEELAHFAGYEIVWSANNQRMAVVDAAVVRDLRREKGWSQRDLAREAGFSAVFVQRVEKEDRPCRLRAVIQLAKTLGVKVDYLLVYATG